MMFDDVTLDHEEAARPRLCAAPHALGADLRSHPDEGRRRGAPGALAEDEFANFETWDKGSFGPTLHTPDMLPREYAREALKRGLKYEEKHRGEPVQVRHDRIDRLPHGAFDHTRKTISSAR